MFEGAARSATHRRNYTDTVSRASERVHPKRFDAGGLYSSGRCCDYDAKKGQLLPVKLIAKCSRVGDIHARPCVPKTVAYMVPGSI